jgi:hypothetical protein
VLLEETDTDFWVNWGMYWVDPAGERAGDTAKE